MIISQIQFFGIKLALNWPFQLTVLQCTSILNVLYNEPFVNGNYKFAIKTFCLPIVASSDCSAGKLKQFLTFRFSQSFQNLTKQWNLANWSGYIESEPCWRYQVDIDILILSTIFNILMWNRQSSICREWARNENGQESNISECPNPIYQHVNTDFLWKAFDKAEAVTAEWQKFAGGKVCKVSTLSNLFQSETFNFQNLQIFNFETLSLSLGQLKSTEQHELDCGYNEATIWTQVTWVHTVDLHLVRPQTTFTKRPDQVEW